MTYQSQVLADSPVTYLELNETSGTAATDQGSHATNGTYTGGVTLNQVGPAGITPVSQFDGVDDYVSVPDHADLDITGDLTLEIWVYPTSFANYRMLITKTLADAGPYEWFLNNSTGLPYFTHQNASGIFGTTAPTLNEWSHLAVTRSGSTITHYLNGVANGSGTIVGAAVASAETLKIGRRSDGFFFLGKLTQAAVYNTALSQARIQAHIAGLPPPVARITQVTADALTAPDSTVRITQVTADALTAPDPLARITQLPVEVLTAPSPNARITQLVIDVLIPSAAVAPDSPVRIIWF